MKEIFELLVGIFYLLLGNIAGVLLITIYFVLGYLVFKSYKKNGFKNTISIFFLGIAFYGLLIEQSAYIFIFFLLPAASVYFLMDD